MDLFAVLLSEFTAKEKSKNFDILSSYCIQWKYQKVKDTKEVKELAQETTTEPGIRIVYDDNVSEFIH